MEESEKKSLISMFSQKFLDELTLADITEKIKNNPQCRTLEGLADYMKITDFTSTSKNEYSFSIGKSEIDVFAKLDEGTGIKLMKVMFSINGIHKCSQYYDLDYKKSA